MEKTIFNSYTEAISALEDFAKENRIKLWFVGGISWGGLLDERTTYKIDIKNKRIYLYNHKPFSDLREDNTLKDIDIIVQTKSHDKVDAFKSFAKTFFLTFNTGLFPIPITIEPIIYSSFGKRRSLYQWVTALEVSTKDQLFLVFDSIKTPIPWSTYESWQIVLQNGLSFTVRNPIADYFAYQIRIPSGVKPKDQKKLVYLKKLADAVLAEGKKQQPVVDYASADYYKGWEEYRNNLYNTSDICIRLKALWTAFYWRTVGTAIAHGKVGSALILKFSDKFTGVK